MFSQISGRSLINVSIDASTDYRHEAAPHHTWPGWASRSCCFAASRGQNASSCGGSISDFGAIAAYGKLASVSGPPSFDTRNVRFSIAA